MLVEDLKSIVADLFKQSEDAVPVFGDGDKKQWMACHLESITDEDGDALQCLIKFDSISDVIDYLENEYKERKNKDHDPSIPCEVHLEQQAKRDHAKGAKAKEDADEPIIVVEEDIIIVKDEGCGC